MLQLMEICHVKSSALSQFDVGLVLSYKTIVCSSKLGNTEGKLSHKILLVTLDNSVALIDIQRDIISLNRTETE